jgi:hypothetical protein
MGERKLNELSSFAANFVNGEIGDIVTKFRVVIAVVASRQGPVPLVVPGKPELP